MSKLKGARETALLFLFNRKKNMLSLNELHLEIKGSGPSLLLLHGFAGSARNWRNLTKAVEGDWRTFCYDLPGHARSAAPHNPDTYTINAQCRLIDQLLEQEATLPAVIGGLSMGAGLALQYAARHPEKLRALILVSFPSGSRYPGGIKHYTQTFANAIETLGQEQAGEEFIWNVEPGFSKRDRTLIRLGFLEHPAHGLSLSLRHLLGEYPEGTELMQLAETIHLPTLIIAGSLDTPAREISELLVKKMPQAQLHIMEKGGHLVNIDSANAFNKIVSNFLESLPMP